MKMSSAVSDEMTVGNNSLPELATPSLFLNFAASAPDPSCTLI